MDFFAHFLAISIIVCLSVLIWGFWIQSKKDTEDIITGAFMKDFYKTSEMLKYLNYDESDKVIADFENKWKPYVPYNEIRYHVGRLIEVQIFNI